MLGLPNSRTCSPSPSDSCASVTSINLVTDASMGTEVNRRRCFAPPLRSELAATIRQFQFRDSRPEAPRKLCWNIPDNCWGTPRRKVRAGCIDGAAKLSHRLKPICVTPPKYAGLIATFSQALKYSAEHDLRSFRRRNRTGVGNLAIYGKKAIAFYMVTIAAKLHSGFTGRLEYLI